MTDKLPKSVRELIDADWTVTEHPEVDEAMAKLHESVAFQNKYPAIDKWLRADKSRRVHKSSGVYNPYSVQLIQGEKPLYGFEGGDGYDVLLQALEYRMAVRLGLARPYPENIA